MSGSDRQSILVLAAIAALLTCATAWADYKTDYARGKNEAGAQNWADVDRLMRQALNESSQPVARLRLYGQRYEPYVPQYYLGLAAWKQNDCASALRWFTDAAAAPIINDNSEFKGIAAQAIKECRSQIAANKPVPQPEPKPVAQDPLPTKPPVVTKPLDPPVTKPRVDDVPVVANNTPAALPAALQNLIDAYLAGRYETAAVADANSVSGNARYHALLLRSAARFALYEMKPQEAASWKADAESDIRIARSLGGVKTPDAAFFSPRFRKFFSEVR